MIYSNLKAEMIKRNISEENLANSLKISRISLENKMKGLQNFNLGEIEYLLKVFNDCSFEYLFQFK